MFEGIPTAPPDPIFALTEACRNDPNPAKINLGAGVYRDEQGRTPTLAVVKEAERRLWQEEDSKSYLPIEGSRRFAFHAQGLLFGRRHPLASDSRLVTVHTPGGTGGLRLVGDFLRLHRPQSTIWLPQPTWVNHAKIYETVGLPIRTYPYLDDRRRHVDLQRLLIALTAAKEDDVILLHGCCHNPSGIDPNPEQWRQLADLLAERGAVPLVDFAYLGFAEGLQADRTGILALAEAVPEMLICTSFSKNFALYNERVGALTIAAPEAGAAAAVLSQLKSAARVNYSNPPAHGAALVSCILESQEMYSQWLEELDSMRQRIVKMRRLFVEGLDKRGVQLAADGNSFLREQRGMFSFSGLSPAQIGRLRQEHSIYIVDSGRVNFASMTSKTMDPLCDAIAQVV